MKKLVILGLVLTSIAGATYAASASVSKHWGEKGSCQQNRFISELNLEPERAAAVAEVLHSYSDITKLYMNEFNGRDQSAKVREFLAQKEAELASILTPEELAQFKRAVGDWAKNKNFNFMKFPHGKA